MALHSVWAYVYIMHVKLGCWACLQFLGWDKKFNKHISGILHSKAHRFHVRLRAVKNIVTYFSHTWYGSFVALGFRRATLVINYLPSFSTFPPFSYTLAFSDYIDLAYFHMLLHSHSFLKLQTGRFTNLHSIVGKGREEENKNWTSLYAYANHRFLNSTKSFNIVRSVVHSVHLQWINNAYGIICAFKLYNIREWGVKKYVNKCWWKAFF